MAAADCFSILPDDLLVRVIFFLPTRDAARTSVLSRRWRPLWPATDALNLDSSSYSHLGAYKLKDRMFSDAGAALRAAGRCPITKLSLFVKGPDDKYCEEVMSHSSRWSWDPVPSYDLLVNLLALQELRRIEELRLDFYSKKKEERPRGIYQLDPAVLPSNTLRVLDLACSSIELPRGDGDAFLLPRLSVLCLRSCSSQMKDLEDFIHAAPCLDSLHIECQNIRSYHNTSDDRLTLRCPTVTTLTLASITLEPSISIEVDAPCLHTLKYEGHFVDFSIKSPATELARVELAFTLKQSSRPFCMPEEPWFGPFWRSVRAFQNIKILKLKVPNIEGIAVGRDGQQTDHLVTFLSLQRLELEGPRDPRSTGDATVAVASLLHCCPMMNSLQIRIIKPKYHYYGRGRKPAPDFGVYLWTCLRGDTRRRSLP
jgi:hypothetical protein